MKNKLMFMCDSYGCVVPINHALNQDGYFRKMINRKVVMYHRHVWEVNNGKIPEGYEIDHLCRNRACCNIDHLECLPGTEHTIRGNTIRYKERKDSAKDYWLENRVTGTELGKVFGVSFGTGCEWIREWKNTC